MNWLISIALKLLSFFLNRKSEPQEVKQIGGGKEVKDKVEDELKNQIKNMILLMGLCLCLGSCGQRVTLVRQPDAPMLIMETKGKYVKVALWDKESKSLLEYGWIETPEGWTLMKYNWDAMGDE